MAITPLNSEFKEYWLLLTPLQKESLLNVVNSFVQDNDGTNEHNLELKEAEAEYRPGDYIKQDEMLKQLKEWEKKSLLLLIKVFLKGRKKNPQPVSIEQYNKEIDYAMSRIDAGEFISHEDVEKEAEQW